MDFAAFEDDLAALLASSLPSGIDIQVLPEDLSEYKRISTRPRVTVGYQMSDFGDTLSNRPVVQEEDITFTVHLEAFSLRDAKGIYTLYNLVKRSLTGYTPPNCDKPCTPKYFGPPLHEPAFIDNSWLYEIHFCTRTISVQDETADDPIVTQSYSGDVVIMYPSTGYFLLGTEDGDYVFADEDGIAIAFSDHVVNAIYPPDEFFLDIANGDALATEDGAAVIFN